MALAIAASAFLNMALVLASCATPARAAAGGAKAAFTLGGVFGVAGAGGAGRGWGGCRVRRPVRSGGVWQNNGPLCYNGPAFLAKRPGCFAKVAWALY